MAMLISQPSRGGFSRLSGAGSRLGGVALYAVIVAWCWWQLPPTLPFVVPAAALGLLLHVWKGQPWLAVIGFALVVGVVPALVWPSMLADAFSGVAGD